MDEIPEAVCYDPYSVYVSEMDDDGGEWWSADVLGRQYRTRAEAEAAVRELKF